MRSDAPFSTVRQASPHPPIHSIPIAIASKPKLVRASINKITVPGSSQRFIDKSRSLTADCVAYDLEDSVTPHKKPEARSLVRRALDQPAPEGIRERAVRINSVDSGLALGDLTEVVSSPWLCMWWARENIWLTMWWNSCNRPTSPRWSFPKSIPTQT